MSKTNDPNVILSRIMHICSNETDLLLGKTARNAPLEPAEIRKLESITRMVTSVIDTQQKLSEKEEIPQITVTNDDIKALSVVAKC